jgi:hypothetical protein
MTTDEYKAAALAIGHAFDRLRAAVSREVIAEAEAESPPHLLKRTLENRLREYGLSKTQATAATAIAFEVLSRE